LPNLDWKKILTEPVKTTGGFRLNPRQLKLMSFTLLAGLYILFMHFDPIHEPVPPDAWEPGPQAFIAVTDFMTPTNLAYLAIVFGLVVAFGYCILERYWRRSRTPAVLAVCGSYWAGYMATLGLFRLFSLYFVMGTSTILTLAAIALICVGGHRARISNLQLKPNLIAICALLVLFLMQGIFEFRFAWVGEGATQYQDHVIEFLRHPEMQFPFITQHLDEIMLSYFVMAPLKVGYHPLLIAWLNLLSNKISIFIFLTSILQTFGASLFFSLGGVIYLFWGSLTFDLFKRLQLFDSYTPISQTVHSGRVVGFPLAALVLYCFFHAEGKKGRPRAWAWALMAVGCGFTSVSNSLLITYQIFMAALALAFEPWVGQEKWICRTWLVAIIALFLGPLLAYQDVAVGSYLIPGWPFVITLMAVFFLTGYILFEVAAIKAWPFFQDLFKRLVGFFPWAVATVITLLFFGNVFINNKIAHWFWYNFQDFTGVPLKFIISTDMQQPRKDLGRVFVDARETGDYTSFNVDGFNFFIFYGPMLMMAMFFLWLIFRPKREASLRALGLWGLANFVIFCPLFFYLDFVNDIRRSYVKTRLLENPFYLIWICTFVGLYKTQSKERLRIIAGVLLSLGLFFIVRDAFALKWLQNVKFLAGLFGWGPALPARTHDL